MHVHHPILAQRRVQTARNRPSLSVHCPSEHYIGSYRKYGAARPELTTAQNFLDRCFKRKYVSKRIDIHQFLEKENKRISNKVSSMHFHPLRPLIPKAKKIQYCLRSKSAVCPPINTDRCKQTYINRLIFKYNLSIQYSISIVCLSVQSIVVNMIIFFNYKLL